MLLRQSVSSVAQQLLCACITADMRMHNSCCACGSQLLCTNYYPDLRHALINQEIFLINIKRGLATASPQDERDISVDLVNNEANHFALYLYYHYLNKPYLSAGKSLFICRMIVCRSTHIPEHLTIIVVCSVGQLLHSFIPVGTI